ncbi:hypothetical protein Ancab_013278 [Ancistrocladus abbreviatus]
MKVAYEQGGGRKKRFHSYFSEQLIIIICFHSSACLTLRRKHTFLISEAGCSDIINVKYGILLINTTGFKLMVYEPYTFFSSYLSVLSLRSNAIG